MKRPCVVVGYRKRASGLRDLILATLQDDKLTVCGAAKLGVTDDRRLFQELESKRSAARRLCRVRCMHAGSNRCTSAMIQFHGFRPGHVWRDPVFVRLDGEVVDGCRGLATNQRQQ